MHFFTHLKSWPIYTVELPFTLKAEHSIRKTLKQLLVIMTYMYSLAKATRIRLVFHSSVSLGPVTSRALQCNGWSLYVFNIKPNTSIAWVWYIVLLRAHVLPSRVSCPFLTVTGDLPTCRCLFLPSSSNVGIHRESYKSLLSLSVLFLTLSLDL